MAELHGLAAQITLVVALLVAGWAAALALTRRSLKPVLVGGFVWAVVLLVVTGLAGVVMALTDTPPNDPLHVVYGILSVVVLPGAWGIARGRADPGRIVRILAIAATVQLILVVRLFQTGA
ncbi:MAG: hypothetical protein HW391_233 [Chloroflexi bacterium]|nr:hypothetical protein [Chloroflexota bacterium]